MSIHSSFGSDNKTATDVLYEDVQAHLCSAVTVFGNPYPTAKHGRIPGDDVITLLDKSQTPRVHRRYWCQVSLTSLWQFATSRSTSLECARFVTLLRGLFLTCFFLLFLFIALSLSPTNIKNPTVPFTTKSGFTNSTRQHLE